MAKTKKTEDTPMLRHYFAVKAQHPEAVLLYRCGDFYECYSDDAVLVSKVLGLVLTKRANGEKGPTEMAGFPHHAIETYLQKLIRAGYKVAICDQLEDPALAKNKLVKRGVTEILTPGVAFGEGMLDQKEHNYLCGLYFEDNVAEIVGDSIVDVAEIDVNLAKSEKQKYEERIAESKDENEIAQSKQRMEIVDSLLKAAEKYRKQ